MGVFVLSRGLTGRVLVFSPRYVHGTVTSTHDGWNVVTDIDTTANPEYLCSNVKGNTHQDTKVAGGIPLQGYSEGIHNPVEPSAIPLPHVDIQLFRLLLLIGAC